MISYTYASRARVACLFGFACILAFLLACLFVTFLNYMFSYMHVRLACLDVCLPWSLLILVQSKATVGISSSLSGCGSMLQTFGKHAPVKDHACVGSCGDFVIVSSKQKVVVMSSFFTLALFAKAESSCTLDADIEIPICSSYIDFQCLATRPCSAWLRNGGFNKGCGVCLLWLRMYMFLCALNVCMCLNCNFCYVDHVDYDAWKIFFNWPSL